ncbi:Pentatricopeptide repeat [Arabidopsis thaliana x Arabidopsis arenosa]|uniref:Pentatricopeptide repeat n=1 Tax=Arabidopsis thaliana x Arabidopsis arenosa TaxID=1240361 RepID=A0A8T2CV16_9BRAS|nr:Pentatricopeptide repeat [Arabidopsis thaliana x Arabidopsis arenosa]
MLLSVGSSYRKLEGLAINPTSKVLFLCEPNRSLLGSSVGVGWNTEHLELGKKVSTEDSSSVSVDHYESHAENGELTLQVYCAMIRGFGKDKRLKKLRNGGSALEMYEDLLDEGPEPNNLSYEPMRLQLRPKSIKQWLTTVKSHGALLSALEKGKLYDEVLRVWNHMVKVGIEPNLYAYTTMASVLTGQQKLNLLDTLLKEMPSKGIIKPSVVTYNAVISGCTTNGLSGVAYEWFHRMRIER